MKVNQSKFNVIVIIASVMCIVPFVFGAIIGLDLLETRSLDSEKLTSYTLCFLIVGLTQLGVASFFRYQYRRLDSRSSDGSVDDGKAYANYLTGIIIFFALCESISVLGFVLYYQGGDRMWALVFPAISLLAMMFFFPKKIELEDYLKQLQKSE